MKILIADDDPQILRALRITLTAKGYTVFIANDGAQAIAAAIDHHPDIYLLDLGMPQLDGIEVIQAIRGWSQAPILVVSGRSGAADKVEALDAGADDYITKPFAVEELLARIRALSRRVVQDDTSPVVRLSNTVIDLASHSVTLVGGAGNEAGAAAAARQIRLTPTEWQFIEILIRNAGKLVTRKTILTSIWGSEHVEDTGYLRLYVSQLRRKLEADPANPVHILTEPGMGYRLEGLSA
ncbi:response regulator transcription factor [Leucobacter sp. cx-42]|uniref:response regulator n=1 Tax=unclassified Leucobacter TaxID=2621730 RepID=UPI00165D665D|nr:MULTISPECIES: response regulator transcription factor [unclassified Leucobacter]MBC9954420.1 response regulator transcription factor [Leucobacter sp. cx-42]